LFVDSRKLDRRTARTAEDEGVDDQQLRTHPYFPEHPLTFDRDFGKAWDDAHALRMAEMLKENPQTKNTVNVVISLRENDELPLWCQRIIDGGWGADVSLSVYVKTEGLKPDEEQVLKRSDRLEMIAIPNHGRSEHAYVWHLARSAQSFASVEIFTKTNHATEGMVKYMVDVAQNGTYDSVSYPWDSDRRYLQVRCDPAWRDHALYHHFCSEPCTSDGPFSNKLCRDGLITRESYKNGSASLVVVRAKVPSSIREWSDLSFALRELPRPLPLIHETYGEGMLAVRRDVLNQHSAGWYRAWKNMTYADAGAKGAQHWAFHHDRAMINTLPLLFSRATLADRFPAWLVSPSTVDLFDTADAMSKFRAR
jgi:hypothetical protein